MGTPLDRFYYEDSCGSAMSWRAEQAPTVVGNVGAANGDRNLVCASPPMEYYKEATG